MICLFAFGFFVVVAGRDMPSTPLSPNDPTLHHTLPPPPPSPVVNYGDVIPQTPYLSKPPSPVINCGDVVPQTPPLLTPPSPVSGDVVPKTPSLSKPQSPDVNHDSTFPHNQLQYIEFTLLLIAAAFVTFLVIHVCCRCCVSVALINEDL